MEKITGYQYIDQPATELLDKLPNDVQVSLKEIFQKIHSAGKADGFASARDYNFERGKSTK